MSHKGPVFSASHMKATSLSHYRYILMTIYFHRGPHYKLIHLHWPAELFFSCVCVRAHTDNYFKNSLVWLIKVVNFCSGNEPILTLRLSEAFLAFITATFQVIYSHFLHAGLFASWTSVLFFCFLTWAFLSPYLNIPKPTTASHCFSNIKLSVASHLHSCSSIREFNFHFYSPLSY